MSEEESTGRPEWHYHAMTDVAFRWNIPVDDAEAFLESVGLFEEETDV